MNFPSHISLSSWKARCRFRAISALVFISVACGGTKAAPEEPQTRESATPALTATPTKALIDTRAVAICDGWTALTKKCPDLDRSMSYDDCTRMYTAAFAYTHTERDAGEIGRCVLGAGDCPEISRCLGETNPSGLYSVHAHPIGPNCTSHASSDPAPHPLLGKPAPLDDLRPLLGKPVLVTFTAAWESSSMHELNLLARLDGATAVVVLANTATEVAAMTTAPSLRLVADDPGSKNRGPIQQAWQVSFLPESFLVDSTGVIRHHFVMMHDWSSASAAECMRSAMK